MRDIVTSKSFQDYLADAMFNVTTVFPIFIRPTESCLVGLTKRANDIVKEYDSR